MAFLGRTPNYDPEIPSFPTHTMLSRSGWRRFLPGKRRNRREDPVIRAIPISEGVPVLHEEETDPEMPEAYPTQPSYVLHLASPLLDDSKLAVIFSLSQPSSSVSFNLYLKILSRRPPRQ